MASLHLFWFAHYKNVQFPLLYNFLWISFFLYSKTLDFISYPILFRWWYSIPVALSFNSYFLPFNCIISFCFISFKYVCIFFSSFTQGSVLHFDHMHSAQILQCISDLSSFCMQFLTNSFFLVRTMLLRYINI